MKPRVLDHGLDDWRKVPKNLGLQLVYFVQILLGLLFIATSIGASCSAVFEVQTKRRMSNLLEPIDNIRAKNQFGILNCSIEFCSVRFIQACISTESKIYLPELLDARRTPIEKLKLQGV